MMQRRIRVIKLLRNLIDCLAWRWWFFWVSLLVIFIAWVLIPYANLLYVTQSLYSYYWLMLRDFYLCSWVEDLRVWKYNFKISRRLIRMAMLLLNWFATAKGGWVFGVSFYEFLLFDSNDFLIHQAIHFTFYFKLARQIYLMLSTFTMHIKLVWNLQFKVSPFLSDLLANELVVE
jgi:hypothetical protein